MSIFKDSMKVDEFTLSEKIIKPNHGVRFILPRLFFILIALGFFAIIGLMAERLAIKHQDIPNLNFLEEVGLELSQIIKIFTLMATIVTGSFAYDVFKKVFTISEAQFSKIHRPLLIAAICLIGIWTSIYLVQYTTAYWRVILTLMATAFGLIAGIQIIKASGKLLEMKHKTNAG